MAVAGAEPAAGARVLELRSVSTAATTAAPPVSAIAPRMSGSLDAGGAGAAVSGIDRLPVHGSFERGVVDGIEVAPGVAPGAVPEAAVPEAMPDDEPMREIIGAV